MLAGGHDLVLDNLLRLDGVRRVERAQFLRGRRLRAYGGQDGAGGQRATAWESSSVGQHRAASAQQLTITFIDFRRVPSISPGQGKLPNCYSNEQYRGALVPGALVWVKISRRISRDIIIGIKIAFKTDCHRLILSLGTLGDATIASMPAAVRVH